MSKIKQTHESQSTEEFHNLEEDKLFTPIEDLQRIEAGGVYKKENLNLSTLPKGIRYIGYTIIGFTVLTVILVLILNFLF
ncbi:MAG: hypothetical protein K0S25_2231 [Bacillus sp. (in: firmicutes)]|nr:hypothetical protein [Bacillus sp. (in: firmicutes)]